MGIDLNNLRTIAKLTYIEINDDIKQMHDKLLSIIEKIETLKKVDTTGIEIFRHIHLPNQIMRDDIVDCENNSDKLAQVAPNFDNNGYQIPIIRT